MAISDGLYSVIAGNVSKMPGMPQPLLDDLEKGPGNNPGEGVFKTAMEKAAGYIQEQQIIQAYLALAYGNVIDRFDECLPNLTHIFGELGISQGDNPFVMYMKLDGGRYAKPLTAGRLLLLNNLYADGILEAVDIEGRSDMRTNHPIFKDAFFELEDPEFTMKSYNWLSNTGKLRQLNYGAIANLPDKRLDKDDVLKVLSIGVSRLVPVTSLKSSKEIYETDPSKVGNIDVLTFRTAFINGGRVDMDYGSFRSTYELKSLLQLANKESQVRTDDNEPSRERNLTPRSATGVDSIRKSIGNLTKEETYNLVRDVIKASGISLDDLRYDLYY